VDGVAVAAVDLHAVEPGGASSRRAAELIDHTGDLVGGEGQGDGHLLEAGGRTAEGATGVRWRGVVRVADTAGMHQLDHDAPALSVDGVGDLAPAGDIRVGVDSRRQQVALTVLGRLGALGDVSGPWMPAASSTRH
jgi:hypothetical protein